MLKRPLRSRAFFSSRDEQGTWEILYPERTGLILRIFSFASVTNRNYDSFLQENFKPNHAKHLPSQKGKWKIPTHPTASCQAHRYQLLSSPIRQMENLSRFDSDKSTTKIGNTDLTPPQIILSSGNTSTPKRSPSTPSRFPSAFFAFVEQEVVDRMTRDPTNLLWLKNHAPSSTSRTVARGNWGLSITVRMMEKADTLDYEVFDS